MHSLDLGCFVVFFWAGDGRELLFIEVNLLNFRCLVKPSALCKAFSAFQEMLANKSDVVFDG